MTPGTVSVTATAQDGSGVTGQMQAMITGPDVPVTTITVSSVGGVTEVLTGDTLQFSVNVLPSEATNKDIMWNVVDQTGSATINQVGLLTALIPGIVSITATAKDGTGETSSMQITIRDPIVPVATINVRSEGDLSGISSGNTLLFLAEILPVEATNKAIIWSVSDHTESATITQGGLLTAITPGTVSVVAAAQDGSSVTGSMQITITDPAVP